MGFRSSVLGTTGAETNVHTFYSFTSRQIQRNTGNRYTRRRRPCDNRDRDWHEPPTSQGAPRTDATSRSQRGQRRVLSKTFRGSMSLRTLTSAFQTPESQENIFLLFEATQFVVICHSSPRKLLKHVFQGCDLSLSPYLDKEMKSYGMTETI